MNAGHILDEMLHQLAAAEERFHRSLDDACQVAAELQVEALSADETVKVVLRGDCGVESVVIHKRAYEEHDAASLRSAVLSAYQRGVLELSKRQHLTIMGTVVPGRDTP